MTVVQMAQQKISANEVKQNYKDVLACQLAQHEIANQQAMAEKLEATRKVQKRQEIVR